MSPDQIDELAHFRARRNRDRQGSDPGAGEAPQSTEQADAIARARESWLLSQLGRAEHARRGHEDGTPGDSVEGASDASDGDD